MDDTDRREFIKQALGAAYLAHTGMHASRELPKLVLPHRSGAVVEIYLQGAHVSSWKRANGEEMFFVSRNNTFAPGEPIRGGIPVVFPQFANLGPLPAHGVVRTIPWRVVETGTEGNGAVFALLEVTDSVVTRTIWPHSFRASLRVMLNERLVTALTITNTGDAPFTFQAALHTYHRVNDLAQVVVEGVEDRKYLDRTVNGAEREGSPMPLRIDGEVDRIYPGVSRSIRIRERQRDRSILVERSGFSDVVIWNPGETKARETIRLPEGEFKSMLAVETAQIVPPENLAPGASWTGIQRIMAE